MKKRLLVAIVILGLLGIGYYIKKEQDNKAEILRIDRQIQELFEPTIQNTTFTIGEDKYILVMDSGKLNVNREDYFRRLDGIAAIDFSVYKNEVKDENLIGSTSYLPHVRRDSLEGYFYIDNKDNQINNTARLFSRFTDVYYDHIYSLNNVEDYGEESSHGSFNEDNIAYDSQGKLVKEGYVHYYLERFSKNLNLVFTALFFMKSNEESINISIDVMHLEEEIKKPYLTSKKFDYNGEEAILYYHKKNSKYIMQYNSDPLIIKRDNNIKLICFASTSVPSIAPDMNRIAYINPLEWEVMGDLYIYHIEKEFNEKVISIDDTGSQNTVKAAKWLDDEHILTIIGFAHGTVSVGGDLYIYDTESDKLELIIDADSIDAELPKGRIEIIDFEIKNDYIALKIAKHDKDFMKITIEEKILKLSDLI